MWLVTTSSGGTEKLPQDGVSAMRRHLKNEQPVALLIFI
jgi:hypothetical protein